MNSIRWKQVLINLYNRFCEFSHDTGGCSIWLGQYSRWIVEIYMRWNDEELDASQIFWQNLFLSVFEITLSHHHTVPNKANIHGSMKVICQPWETTGTVSKNMKIMWFIHVRQNKKWSGFFISKANYNSNRYCGSLGHIHLLSIIKVNRQTYTNRNLSPMHRQCPQRLQWQLPGFNICVLEANNAGIVWPWHRSLEQTFH